MISPLHQAAEHGGGLSPGSGGGAVVGAADEAQTLGQKEEGVFEFSLEAEPGADIRRELFKRLSERSYPLLGLKTTELTLEDIFLQLTQDGGNSIPTDGGAK